MDQYSLTPHQRWVTQEHNMERAYTGCYYEFAEPGSYDCSCCGSTLFKSEHKYSNESGYASFWASENLAVRDGDNYDMEKWDDTNIIREEFKMPKTDPVDSTSLRSSAMYAAASTSAFMPSAISTETVPLTAGSASCTAPSPSAAVSESLRDLRYSALRNR